MATGIVFLNDRDIETDFAVTVSALAGFPGILGSAPRDVPMLDGPEMSDAIFDPRLMRRKPGTGTVNGFINAATLSAAMTALDALRGTLLGGEFALRTGHASDRHCLTVCTQVDGQAYQGEALNGRVAVSLSFTVKDGVAVRVQPDGYALSTTRVACPIGTAESRPMILVHGGGATLTNPTVTIRNAAGDVVQTCGFTASLGANDALRIDCARTLVSRLTAGVVSDALAAGLWTSGDYGMVLRPYDGFVEAGAYPSVEVSSTGGVAQGEIEYTRRYA
jgi:hypothetical protein